MSAPSKIPPRFVPTLTDVVKADAAQVPSVQAAEPLAAEPGSPVQDEAAAWAREGMLAPRRGVVSLPASLPPLPEDLEPQRSMPAVQIPPHDGLLPAVLPRAESSHGYQPPTAPAVEVQLAQESGQAEPLPEEAGPQLRMEQELVVQPAAAPAQAPETMESLWDTHAQQVTEEYLVHRLMQRVDLVLDQRLRDAIATVVQQQTRSIVVRLREEVESVVRQAVYEAVADELAHQAKAARGDPAQGGR